MVSKLKLAPAFTRIWSPAKISNKFSRAADRRVGERVADVDIRAGECRDNRLYGSRVVSRPDRSSTGDRLLNRQWTARRDAGRRTSLTALTTRLAVSVAVEKAVVPPFVDALARLPLVPLVWSQARKVMALASVPL